MKDVLFIRIGRISNVFNQITNWLFILIFLTIFTLVTGGIGGIISVIYYLSIKKFFFAKKTIQKLYSEYLKSEINFETFNVSWKKTKNITWFRFTLLIIVSVLILFSKIDLCSKLIIALFFLTFAIIQIPQILYLKEIKKRHFDIYELK